METLEEILQLLGSEEPFLSQTEIDCYGRKNVFTENGEAAYDKLIAILSAVGFLTDTSMSHIVEKLDRIANEEC